MATSEAIDESAAADAAQMQDDDDAVIVPAAPLEYLGHIPASSYRHKSRAQRIDLDSLKFRQMMIPIFLTSGFLLLVAGTLRFIVGTDAPLSDLPGWLSYLAWTAGVMMLAGAVLNMMRVRNQLARANEG